MAKSLVIVESPAKSNTIKKILGKNFTVTSSMGHIMDLPKSKMGIDIKKDFTPEYIMIPGKKKIVDALKKAAAAVDNIDMNMVDAQQARRVLDRLVGYSISPLLWRKVGRGLSAGRVQSVAVRLVVDRENEIRVFIPDEYWEIEAEL